MKTKIALNAHHWREKELPKGVINLLLDKGKFEFHLSIPRITLWQGAVFDYASKKYDRRLAFIITQVRCDPFEDVLVYRVDLESTDLTDKELVDELMTVWTEPVC
jgi:hypothetical protein